MTSATLTKPMTTEELLALPQDGTERWLIAGELREKPAGWPEKPMTLRNRFHSKLVSRICFFLESWRERQPPPRGEVLAGEAGVRLCRDPETTVGIDVVYISPEVAAQQTGDTTLVEGVPLLTVEILSPNDTVDEIHEKISTYLNVGVSLVWILDPYDRTVTIYQPNAPPSFVNEQQELTGDPTLPGFRVPLADLFR
jgi:Uma2 family endonuclease